MTILFMKKVRFYLLQIPFQHHLVFIVHLQCASTIIKIVITANNYGFLYRFYEVMSLFENPRMFDQCNHIQFCDIYLTLWKKKLAIPLNITKDVKITSQILPLSQNFLQPILKLCAIFARRLHKKFSKGILELVKGFIFRPSEIKKTCWFQSYGLLNVGFFNRVFSNFRLKRLCLAFELKKC